MNNSNTKLFGGFILKVRIILIILFLSFFNSFAGATDTVELWRKVNVAQNEGLPQTAVDNLKQIYLIALGSGKSGEALAALCKQIVLESNIAGNKPEEKIKRLQEEIEKADPRMKPLMKAVLAQWYWHYFSRNRYRFMNRTQTAGLSEKDFTTWDLPKLFKKISDLHQDVLTEEIQLKAVKISDFKEIIESGSLSALWPTLFDFTANKALEFYTSGEQAAAQPQDAFEIRAASDVLAEASKFINYKPETTDDNSSKLFALKIFQRLMASHINDADKDAFLDLDIRRLIYFKNVSSGSEKSEKFIERMKEIAAEYKKSEYSALATYHWANEVYSGGSEDGGGAAEKTSSGKNFVEALKIASEGAKAYPNSYGGRECQALMIKIESKEMEISAERVVLAGKKSSLSVKYKNIDAITFRAVRDDWHDYLDEGSRKNFNWIDKEELETLLSKKPEAEWTVQLKPTDDYKQAMASVYVPELKHGFYRIFASYKKDFSLAKNRIVHCMLWVSDISIISRTRDGGIEGLVLNSDTGVPVKNATVKIYDLPDNYDRRNRKYEVVSTTQTDEMGRYSIKTENYRRGGLIYATDNDKSEFIDPHVTNAYKGHSDTGGAQTMLFTDRAIYRPGQIINFKGICINVNKFSDDYKILPGQNVTVFFRDHNHQEIAREKFRSNDFGSFSGSFTAPSGRAAGTMNIIASSPGGNCTVRVEEYKRPKFTVEVKKPEQQFKLNDDVAVEGEAVSYTGAPIDSAMVKYRVTREVRMPQWWCYFWHGPVPANNAREIANGKMKTDAAGKFTVKFKALADNEAAKAEGTTFVYMVYADVTDGTGETRGGSQSIRIGDTAMEASLTAEKWQVTSEPVKISIDTKTLDGKPIAAEGVVEIFELAGPKSPVKADLAFDFGYWYWMFSAGGKKSVLDGDENSSNYALWPIGKSVDKKGFNTDGKGSSSIEVKLAAGSYRAILTSNDRFGNKVKSVLPIIVIDPAAKKFNVSVPEYFVVRSTSVEVGDKFTAFWGTGYESGSAYIEIIHKNQIVKSYWTAPGETAHTFEIPVGEQYRGGFMVATTYVREGRLYSNAVSISVPWSNKKFDIKFETYRSKLVPGQDETWTIKIKGPGAEHTAAEFVAALYDESLDAFAPLRWNTFAGLFRSDNSNVNNRFSNAKQNYAPYINTSTVYMVSYSRIYPNFLNEIVQNYYGYGNVYSRNGKGVDYYDEEGGMSFKMESRSDVSRMKSVGAVPTSPSAMPSGGAPEMKTNMAKSSAAAFDGPGDNLSEPRAQSEVAQPDLSKVAARKNLNETAFFFPQLLSDADGTVKIIFKMPEALTKWHFMGFAHGVNLENALIEEHAVTQKDLMVVPNPPRFLREGDELWFSVKVTNMVESEISGKVRLTLLDPVSEKPVDDLFSNAATDQDVKIPAKESRSFYWKLMVPDNKIDMVKFKAVASAGNQSDGEEGIMPVLSRRIFVQESIPLPIRGIAEKKFKFEKLIASAKSDTLRNKSFTVQMTSNPSWYAVQALPYLMEFPHECSEQTFNRLYANALAKHIADSDSKIRRVFDLWKGTDVLLSNLEKNEQLKSVALLETPWVVQGKNETEAKHNIGILFDDNRLSAELKATYEKLKNMQLSDGAWPWFPGGYPDSYITLYIVTGFGRMKNLEINKVSFDIAIRALDHLDRWIDKTYRDILKDGHKNQNNLGTTIALYLYGRSFYLKDRAISPDSKEAVDYFLKQAEKYWLELDNRMSQGHLALALYRFGDKETPKKIMASIKERSQTSEELGMFWGETELSWWWYRAPIETQALMIEAFAEVTDDTKSVEDCKVWLLKQKQTQDWKTTKATSDAIYSLLCRGENLLASNALVEVTVGGNKIEPQKVEAGTGFYEKRYVASEVKPEFGDIIVKKTDAGVAWGGAHWQYMEDMSKVTPHEQNPLTLKKSVFVKRDTKSGPVIEPVGASVCVGDLLVIRIELRTDRDMEYVHMKDQRGSGLEPVNVLSQYKYQDGLRYYESTRDTASHFYIDYLPKGTYVFEYQLRVQHRGKYQNGMANIECMYAPEFNSHSESVPLNAEEVK